ncbi:MAG: Dabb family protein [Acidobacteria bacterium]|nr:MAG: Dabb family protein [Acidobacteriota bacterium]
MIRHIVLFSLREPESPEAGEMLASLCALPDQISEIRGFMLGPAFNDSHSFQFALTVDGDDVDVLTRYRDHPVTFLWSNGCAH